MSTWDHFLGHILSRLRSREVIDSAHCISGYFYRSSSDSKLLRGELYRPSHLAQLGKLKTVWCEERRYLLSSGRVEFCLHYRDHH